MFLWLILVIPAQALKKQGVARGGVIERLREKYLRRTIRVAFTPTCTRIKEGMEEKVHYFNEKVESLNVSEKIKAGVFAVSQKTQVMTAFVSEKTQSIKIKSLLRLRSFKKFLSKGPLYRMRKNGSLRKSQII